MPIRDLTEDEAGRLLTQEQLDALPEGTPVYVKWGGGNGPHLYHTGKHFGSTTVDNIYRDFLDRVGTANWQNRVFLPKD